MFVVDVHVESWETIKTSSLGGKVFKRCSFCYVQCFNVESILSHPLLINTQHLIKANQIKTVRSV